ncbi:unnamed protein product [Eruca vesicaria subsp. sativa]|uniref:Maturase K n=1 Tax=Eruca vesicaria subsp. sativa TaxID=29727 RepID=A0ABC8M4M3_ERUVS|nr:unnamed protein product [Eruca vesicaria subsp. sativa]
MYHLLLSQICTNASDEELPSSYIEEFISRWKYYKHFETSLGTSAKYNNIVISLFCPLQRDTLVNLTRKESQSPEPLQTNFPVSKIFTYIKSKDLHIQ